MFSNSEIFTALAIIEVLTGLVFSLFMYLFIKFILKQKTNYLSIYLGMISLSLLSTVILLFQLESVLTSLVSTVAWVLPSVIIPIIGGSIGHYFYEEK